MKTEPLEIIAQRLRIAAKQVGGLEILAQKTGTPRRTLGNYLAGRNEPKLSFLLAVSGLTGRSVDWLAGGEEESDLAPPPPKAAIDGELMGRVTDAISRLYKDERVGLPPIDLGRLAAEKYSEIVEATGDPAERLAMIKLVIIQLRSELRAAAATPGAGKASA